MSVVDQYNDPAFGTLFRQVKQMPGLEAFVKEASVDASEVASLPDTAFAWENERRFPVHTKEHAALSYAYAKAASEKVPASVMGAIKTACEIYGVPETVFETQKVAAVELQGEDFLLPEMRLFPAKTALQVKVSQERLVANLHKLDLEKRAEACANLVKKADELGITLHPEVEKLAGFVVSSTKIAAGWLEARASVATEATYKVAYEKLADGLKKLPPESKDREGLLKLASVIADLDEKSGLDLKYDRQLPDALRTVFNTEKNAVASVDLNGTMVPITKLASLPASFWADLGGQELADEIAPGGRVDPTKLASVVETLPLDLKVTLKSQLRM